jgi:hypothetical protein
MDEAISLGRQSEGTITGIHIFPGVLHELTSELRSTLIGYGEYLSEKTSKFMSNAKTSAVRHGIDFEEKIILIIKPIAINCKIFSNFIMFVSGILVD